MDKCFRDKAAKVLIVEASGATRTLITETVRKLGFSDITGVPSAKDAFEQMEVDDFGWVITSTFKEQPVNAFHLLRIVTEEVSLKETRISLMVNDDERQLLPLAFKLGLLSFHLKPITKDSLSGQLGELMKAYSEHSYRGSLVAGQYLREYLGQAHGDEELLSFEKELINQYPGEPELMINLVPPMSRLEQKEQVKTILRQLQVVCADKSGKIMEYIDKYTDGQLQTNVPEGEIANLLGLSKVLIVDPDHENQKVYRECLEELGVKDLVIVDDGEHGEKAAKEAAFDFVIMEWRLAKVPGPLLIQRLKHSDAFNAPIMVATELLDNEDYPLVKEMGVALVLKKPLVKKNIIEALVLTVQQERMPTDQGSMERKMRDFIRAKKFADALPIKNRFLKDPDISDGAKESIQAEFCYAQRAFDKARDHGIEAIKLGGDSLFVLNLLGKCLIQLRDFEPALRCFNKAQSMSPKNVERLCMIAETHSAAGDQEQADKTLADAKSVDGDSVNIAEAEAKVAINAGDLGRAQALMGELDAIENVVSYMNNSAVALARCDLIAQSLEQYRKTLASIPENKAETKAIVMYNLALAHIRAQELEEAKIHLERCLSLKAQVRGKAENLLKSVKKALEKGVPLNIAKKSPSPAGVPLPQGQQHGDSNHGEEFRKDQPIELIATVTTAPRDVGLFLIYRPKSIDAQALTLIDGMPRYRRRNVISREESRGADKNLASSA